MRAATGIAWPFAGLVIAFFLCARADSGAQPDTRFLEPEEAIKLLIVRIDTDFDFGAGIIVGARSGLIYVATANHVVRRGDRETARLDVQLRGLTGPPLRGKLLPEKDEGLDLAVLSFTDAKNLSRSLPFDRLGDPRVLERGDPIFLLGHPNGLPWRVNTVPERFIERRAESLDFESNLLAKGHSGGALLNESGDLIGLLKSDAAPYGEAIDIYAIARKVAGWNYPVNLRLPPPRVSAGDSRTCVLMPRGEVDCWGFDSRYERGPLEMPDVRLRALDTGGHACGIAAGGAAFCVGNNSAGELGDGTKTSNYDTPVAVQGGFSFISIGAGVGHTCGVVRSGEVYCWGQGSQAQLGSLLPEGSPTPVRVPLTERFKTVSSSWGYSCALTDKGRAFCWGAVGAVDLMMWKPSPFAETLSFVRLTTGYHHVCGIATSGAAFCWGFNDEGQLGDGLSSKEFDENEKRVAGGLTFTSISAGVSHTCGVAAGGKAYCWGLNNFGQLGNGTKTPSRVPSPVSGGLAFDSIDAGNLHTCGVTINGEVYCWGSNSQIPRRDASDGGVGPSGKSEHTVPWRVRQISADERFPWRGGVR